MSAPSYTPSGNEKLEENHIDIGHAWCNHTIAELKLKIIIKCFSDICIFINHIKLVCYFWKQSTLNAELKLNSDELIAMIIRGEESLIPDGKTMILENDVVVTYRE